MIMDAATSKWPRAMLCMLLVSVFFEGSGYSFHLLGVRVRSVQIFEFLFLGILGALALLGKWRWRKSPLDFWLLAYLAVNFVAIFNSSWKARSIKIFLLLVSLVLLYWLVYQLLQTAKDMILAFYVFLAMGALQVLFGLYQVLAGALNHYQKWRLPIGHLGLVHREYINSVWGRPYGTQVEPDFYGAICMVFALIFLILFFSEGGRKKWQCAGALLSLLGLYFSFVRVSWLVFLLVLLLLPFGRKKMSFFKLNWLSVLLIIGSAAGVYAAAFYAVPPIRQICKIRFATRLPVNVNEAEAWKMNDSLLNRENVRLSMIQTSLRTWKEHLVLGAGPGSFAYSWWRSQLGETGARQKIAEKAFPLTNPSLLFNLIADSGLLGLLIFLVLTAKFITISCRTFTQPWPESGPRPFALAVGLMALLLTYVLTNGIWMPLSWILLGLATAQLREFPGRGDGPGTAGPLGRPCA